MVAEKKLIFKVIAWSIAIHIVLIVLTILEVFVYSHLINPGKELTEYEAHAQASGPYISLIFGFILIFVIAKHLLGKYPDNRAFIGYGLPITYILVDVILLILAGTDFISNYEVFTISYLTKLGAGQAALWRTKH